MESIFIDPPAGQCFFAFADGKLGPAPLKGEPAVAPSKISPSIFSSCSKIDYMFVFI